MLNARRPNLTLPVPDVPVRPTILCGDRAAPSLPEPRPRRDARGPDTQSHAPGPDPEDDPSDEPLEPDDDDEGPVGD